MHRARAGGRTGSNGSSQGSSGTQTSPTRCTSVGLISSVDGRLTLRHKVPAGADVVRERHAREGRDAGLSSAPSPPGPR